MKSKFYITLISALAATAVLAQDNTAPQPATPAPAPATSAPAGQPDQSATPAPAPAPEAKPKSTKKKKSSKSKSTAKTKASTASKNLVYNPPAVGTVKQEAVNVRGQPSFIGEVITHLHKGETVSVLEEINLKHPKKDEPTKWAKISMPTNTPVWVSGDYVDAASMTAKSRLNVRGGPGENYSVVARLDKGTPVKELRKNKGWIEIETPTNAYGFVAADFLKVEPATAPAIAATTPAPEPAPAPAPAPAPEQTTVAPQALAVAANPNEAPAAPAANPAEAVPTTPAEQTPPVAPAPEVSNEPPPKRVVTREGLVHKARNIQAPTDYELRDSRTGETIEYLMSATPNKTLKPYLGTRVLVTGPEALDARWKSTPIVEVESIELP